MTDHPAVAGHDLVYTAGETRVLNGVCLSVAPGECVGVVGPNGAGKSTLLRALAGLVPLEGGVVTVNGSDLREWSRGAIARYLAYLPQAATGPSSFTSLETVGMGRYPHMTRLEVEGDPDRRVILEAMAATETTMFATRSLDTLSGGERQRVLLARVIAQQPRVLLLDEPTSSLDLQHQLAVLEIVGRLGRAGVATVVATHDLAFAARLCDRLVLLRDGCVVTAGAPDQVLTPPAIEAAFDVRVHAYREPTQGHLCLSVVERRIKGGDV